MAGRHGILPISPENIDKSMFDGRGIRKKKASETASTVPRPCTTGGLPAKQRGPAFPPCSTGLGLRLPASSGLKQRQPVFRVLQAVFESQHSLRLRQECPCFEPEDQSGSQQKACYERRPVDVFGSQYNRKRPPKNRASFSCRHQNTQKPASAGFCV